jgi:hypothetical protein
MISFEKYLEEKKGFWLYRRNPSGVADKSQDEHGKFDRKKVFRTEKEAQAEADKRNKKTSGDYWKPVSIAAVSGALKKREANAKIVSDEFSRGDLVVGHQGKFAEEKGIVLRVEDEQIVVKLEGNNKKVWVSPKNFKSTGERRELPKP